MVIRSDSNSDSASADLTAGFANPANPADLAVAAVAVTVTAFLLVPDLVAVLLSLVLLTGAVLYSLDLRSSAYLLLVYLVYLPVSLFLDETVLAFLTFCSFLRLAVLRILYRPVEKQVRLRILM